MYYHEMNNKNSKPNH